MIGKSDPIRQEIPVAFVIPTGGVSASSPEFETEILTACERELADFKVPRKIYFLDDFPRSVLQKIAKAKLREQLEANEQ